MSFPFITPPSPPRPFPPPSYTWWPPPPPSNHNSVVAGLTMAFGFIVLVLCCACRLPRANCDDGVEAATALAAPPQAPPPDPWDGDEGRRQRRVTPTSGLPSFTYNRSAMHKARGGGGDDEATTCSVCLGAFETGETVRLLPVCLHLYHVGCIDPWLDTHSTCPICRSGTDPAMTDGSLHPPV